jgi:hypothetical protein
MHNCRHGDRGACNHDYEPSWFVGLHVGQRLRRWIYEQRSDAELGESAEIFGREHCYNRGLRSRWPNRCVSRERFVFRGTMKKSPIQIVRDRNKVKIEMEESGELLAWCYIGDDENLERIADILSAKRLPEDAMRLRKMGVDARIPNVRQFTNTRIS